MIVLASMTPEMKGPSGYLRYSCRKLVAGFVMAARIDW